MFLKPTDTIVNTTNTDVEVLVKTVDKIGASTTDKFIVNAHSEEKHYKHKNEKYDCWTIGFEIINVSKNLYEIKTK